MEKKTCIYVYIYIRVVSSAPEMTKMGIYFNDLKYSYTCNNICVYLPIFVSIHRCVGIYICI